MMAAADDQDSRAAAVGASIDTGSRTLQLVRSFAIPTDDPSYLRLLDWSWTYDSAITATAFAAAGDFSEAEQLLDQLAALQHTDGSVEIAFNVGTGQASSVIRAGTIAVMGLAGSVFDQTHGSARYLAMQRLAAGYLLSLQGSNGLVRGGPDVSWYSTQHNLLAYAFLVRLGNELTASGDASDASRCYVAAGRIASAIDANLIVQDGSTAYLGEGPGDPLQALDVQALGVLYLQSRGHRSLAEEVLAHAQGAFALSGRSIVLSSDPSTYNMTYAAEGPFSGFMPYVGANAPEVLWSEGTAEMRIATATLGQPTDAVDQSLDAIANIPGADGVPVQADRTLTSKSYGVEYHVWPAAAAGAWQILAQQKNPPALFPTVSSYTDTIAADAPGLWYRLDDTSGTTAKDSSTAGHNGTYVGNVTLGAPGVTGDGDTAATFDGATGYVSNPARWTNPQVFTLEAWIKTTSTNGGLIVGFADVITGAAGNYDRQIYINNAGQLYFGVNFNKTVHSSASYNDGNWHLVDASLSAGGIALYIDGALVATNPAITSAQTYNGYWRVGYDSLGGWASHPTSNDFAGTIDEVAVYPTALTPAQVSARYLSAR